MYKTKKFLITAIAIAVCIGSILWVLPVQAASGNKIKLNYKSVTLQVGDTWDLRVISDSGGKTAKNVTWKSSDKKIVSVDKNGRIKAKKAGTAKITATTKNRKSKASCTVKVKKKEASKIMNIQAGKTLFTAELADNSSAQALAEKLAGGPVTIEMRDYGDFEKVGALGFDLVTNNKQITTEPGDLVLYQGNQLVIFYGSNSWSYTRLGKIQNATVEELKAALGDGDVTVTLSLP